MKLLHLLGLAVLALAPIGLAGPARAQPATAAATAPAEAGATLSVTGTGRVSRAPDMASIVLGVTAEGKTAAEAVAGMSKDLAAVLAHVRTEGIEGRDVQTSGLSLSPRWSQPRPGSTAPARIEGFVASSRVTVTVRALDRLGRVLDQVVKAGANGFSGLTFALSDPAPVEDAARKAAVADAIHKAGVLAAAAGLTLGPVREISDEAVSRPPLMFAMKAAPMGSEVPVAQGEIDTQVTVRMVFALGR
ncbi:MAG: SIMPL domain-containing protein [Paracoccaceae bacterium]|nr:SIMPL domain-containing protein [Paracoccaceae bacterium]